MSEVITKEIQKLIMLKEFESAIELCNKNVKKISKKQYYYLSAVSNRYLENYDEALKIIDSLIQLDPYYGRAYQEFGHVHMKLKNKDKSLKGYIRAVRHNPSLQASWLGILAINTKNDGLINLAQENIVYLKNLAPELKSVISFMHEGRLAKADLLCRDFLQKYPHDVEAMRLLAKIGTDLYIFEDAEFLLESALIFDPDNIKLKFDYVNILIKRQKYGEAVVHAENFYKKHPENINAMRVYATSLFRTDKYKKALDLYNKILEKEPNNIDVLLSMGHLYKTSGDIDNSIKSYKKTYTTDKYFGDAYWSLANLKTYQFSSEEISSLKSMIKDQYVSDDEKVFMHFSLGKAYEDMKDFKKSFKHYKEANDYKSKKSLFNLNDFKSDCKNQIEVCTKDLFEQKSDWGCESHEPIFILGLPRVGSTLVEQILSSHSLVDATHELPNIISTSMKLNQRQKQNMESRYPDILLSLSSPQLKMIGEKYIKDAEVFRSNGKFFIDKMPNNFKHIGLIKLILPNSKIIDIRRSSMSACFSCYKQLFAEGQEFTYNLADLAGYYNNYVELMNHWNKVFPNQILSINYEDIVNDVENSVRKILDYCSLDFEQNCVDFYKSKRAVKTPSAEQVRQPIYTSGMDYWKNYEPFLSELKNNLKY
tara:strand:- start:95 stop:2044 length:1950 start_codon:yes stop_codon:yes gene_type:complete